jgi:hypothetical protein
LSPVKAIALPLSAVYVRRLPVRPRYFTVFPPLIWEKWLVSEMLARSDIPPEMIEQLVFGQVVQMPEAPNIAREIVLGTGMSVHTDAYSVSRACATSFRPSPTSRRA